MPSYRLEKLARQIAEIWKSVNVLCIVNAVHAPRARAARLYKRAEFRVWHVRKSRWLNIFPLFLHNSALHASPIICTNSWGLAQIDFHLSVFRGAKTVIVSVHQNECHCLALHQHLARKRCNVCSTDIQVPCSAPKWNHRTLHRVLLRSLLRTAVFYTKCTCLLPSIILLLSPTVLNPSSFLWGTLASYEHVWFSNIYRFWPCAAVSLVPLFRDYSAATRANVTWLIATTFCVLFTFYATVCFLARIDS